MRNALSRMSSLSLGLVIAHVVGQVHLSAIHAQDGLINSSTSQLGIAKEPLQNVRCVEFDGVFMIPYSTKIPGTEVSFEMIPIPGGVALIGNPSDASDRAEESPQIRVAIEPLWVGKCEITQEEFQQFLQMDRLFRSFKRRGIRKVTADRLSDAVSAPTTLYDVSFRDEVGKGPQLPAIGMTQFAAKQYTKWLSRLSGLQYRLPTEAEWEYACRAGATSEFYFGNDASQLSHYAWYAENSDEQLHRVGSKAANAWGLHDMHGSVREWTMDGFSSDGYQALALLPSPIPLLQAIQWPKTVEHRVARGGSWADAPEALHSSARFSADDEAMKDQDPEVPPSPWWYTSDPSRTIGFRIVRSLRPLDESVIQKFHNADHQSLIDDLHDSQGWERTIQGLVDPTLAEEIRQAAKDVK
ncbi:MAG: formylglycine-generating enzyme family protein [Pirellulales bacterium]